jgi:hypothetical protein
MPSYSESTPLQLRKRLNQLIAAQEAATPELTAEIRLVRSLLAAKEDGHSGQVYSASRTPRDAIELCLNLSGDFALTKREMVKAIIGGGYQGPKPEATYQLIGDSIRNQLRAGYLIEQGGVVGRPLNPKAISKR